MPASVRLTPEQRARERSILLAVWLDLAIWTALVLAGVLGGVLTMLAEAIRGGLAQLIELFAFLVMRRVHRNVLADLEYGTGKLEQFANLAIAGGMVGGAIWIVMGALALATGERNPGTPIGTAAAAIIGIVNVYINVLAWDAMRRAASGGDSLIMQGQLTSRVVRLVSSLIVGMTLTLAAVSTDDVVAAWADIVGSTFVAGFILFNALGMLGTGIPDLLDRTAGLDVQHAINRALARHFDDYDRLDRVRSRLSGQVVFIEIALGFDGTLTMAEIDRRIAAMKASIAGEVPSADISILASPHPA